ncbi:MAG: lipid-A-disaccharide synthase, partial [Steroidobacteraceae bacterium]|nr:lipid-A-disaccharide synthase [Deltaproteobacteria bacterium]
RLVKIPNIGLCNIVAGETVVRELIQDEANPKNISAEIVTILSDDNYDDTIRHKLAEIRSRLGCGGASRNVARLILTLMEQP